MGGSVSKANKANKVSNKDHNGEFLKNVVEHKLITGIKIDGGKAVLKQVIDDGDCFFDSIYYLENPEKYKDKHQEDLTKYRSDVYEKTKEEYNQNPAEFPEFRNAIHGNENFDICFNEPLDEKNKQKWIDTNNKIWASEMSLVAMPRVIDKDILVFNVNPRSGLVTMSRYKNNEDNRDNYHIVVRINENHYQPFEYDLVSNSKIKLSQELFEKLRDDPVAVDITKYINGLNPAKSLSKTNNLSPAVSNTNNLPPAVSKNKRRGQNPKLEKVGNGLKHALRSSLKPSPSPILNAPIGCQLGGRRSRKNETKKRSNIRTYRSISPLRKRKNMKKETQKEKRSAKRKKKHKRKETIKKN